MNILSYYHQNRKKIWTVIMAIIILIIAIQAINGIVENKKNKKDISNNTINANQYKNNLNINILLSEEDVQKQEELIIDQFLRYCNANKIEEAYDLLTKTCKEQLFPTIDIFKVNYMNQYFLETKLYKKQYYLENTYLITLYQDALSTGSISTGTIQDYFTIEKENNDIKLNICNYIGDKGINRNKTEDFLTVKVIKKHVYKDYEQYEMQVTNLTYNTILLDSQEDTKTMYLEGKNNVKYYSLSHEILKENLIIKPKATVSLFIKYNKEYNSNQTVKQLVFSDIILDYEQYQQSTKKNDYQDRKTITITL